LYYQRIPAHRGVGKNYYEKIKKYWVGLEEGSGYSGVRSKQKKPISFKSPGGPERV